MEFYTNNLPRTIIHDFYRYVNLYFRKSRFFDMVTCILENDFL